jgi:putative NADH-flavin reductase
MYHEHSNLRSHRFFGSSYLELALSKGFQVTVLVRNKSVISIQHDNLIIIQGNVLNTNDVRKALEHQEAVIQCLGIGGKGDGNHNTFISDATNIIVKEMEQLQIKRLIAMSNIGAGNSYRFQPWYFRKVILPYFIKWLKVIIDDKNQMEPIIMNSKLDWTIVRCPNIIDKTQKGNVLVTLDGKGLKLTVTLGDMSDFMIQQIIDRTYSKQAPSISN